MLSTDRRFIADGTGKWALGANEFENLPHTKAT
jgi:hypothetical protein